MYFPSKLSVALLCAASVVALASAADAQTGVGEANETIVVTGSRVIADAANSPTPLTVVSVTQLQATTPTDIPTALNKLPIFSESNTPQRPGGFTSNSAGNVLNMRNFGAQRTLILLDGHRVPASNPNGTVDIDTLPQMLMQRVDVVTGGASAVYGSDAVTGVVNFVLDKHFTGFKVNANAGISTYSDGASYQAGMAAGTDLFGGRGHVEVALRHFHQDGIPLANRPYGNDADWVATGAGTAASPYVSTIHGTLQQFSFGGKITCTGCAANNMQFVANGVIGPFDSGTPTGTGNVFSGGDGGHTEVQNASAEVTTDEAFSRFSYNLDDTTTFYVQGILAQAQDHNGFNNNYIQTGTSPNIFSSTNPFLTPEAQAQLANPSGTFKLAEYFNIPAHGGVAPGFLARQVQNNLVLTGGLDGTLAGKYDWDIYYTHGESRLEGDNPNNQSAARMYAAEDAISSGGKIVCQVSTTTFADLFPGCVPINPFGPTSLTKTQYNYITVDTRYVQKNTLDNIGGSISGKVFQLPAGPVKAALSGEMRWLDYTVTTNTPVGFVDCTGLRRCNTGAPAYLNSSVGLLPTVSENVWEFAAEADVPLLKDAPLIQSLSANLAGRYTDYSVSGAVETWKIGLDWHINDDVRFRATNSIDIRAPTLDDLYSPLQISHAGFVDLHTGNTNQSGLMERQGNPDLVPEVARTYTAGVVLTPSFVPGLTMSIDYYRIGLTNAIGSVGGASAGVQQTCENSNGASPLCALFVRPFPFSNRTPANYPTAILTESLNNTFNRIEGWDFELDYGFALDDVWDSAAGTVNLRVLANNQPVNETEQYPGAPLVVTPVPKTRITAFAAYALGSWTFNLENRWLSPFRRTPEPGILFFAVPYGKHLEYVDVNIDKKFEVDGNSLDLYFAVQNVLNATPPIEPSNTTLPGFYAAGQHPSVGSQVDGVDNIGRYFTMGVRANL